jgi:hypothetical protein
MPFIVDPKNPTVVAGWFKYVHAGLFLGACHAWINRVFPDIEFFSPAVTPPILR